MKHLFPLTAILFCLALVIAPAFAHHAISAKFNTEESITLNGPVTQIDWSAPHAHMFINVGSNDTVVNWAIELRSPTELARAAKFSRSIVHLHLLSGDNLQPEDRDIMAFAIQLGFL